MTKYARYALCLLVYIFTCLILQVFGQQIFYNFIERGFVYDPPIKKKRNVCIFLRKITNC